MKDGICPKCGEKRVGRLATVPDKNEYGGDRSLARIRTEKKDIFSLFRIHELKVEAYVCANCGYFEEYVKEPGSVPWDKIEELEWLDG